FVQAEDGIRDWSVTGFRRVLFRSWHFGVGRRGANFVGADGLAEDAVANAAFQVDRAATRQERDLVPLLPFQGVIVLGKLEFLPRSEERRGGKECRAR